MPRTQYIFIDYENVCVTDLSPVAGQNAVVYLVLGQNQEKLPVDITLFVQRNPAQLHILRTKVVGRNALDLVLAVELGRKLAADPDGDFHIISKDTDYQSVVLHLKAERRTVARHKSLMEIPAFRPAGKPASTRSPNERQTLLIRQLRDKTSKNRPTSRAKLENLIKSTFGLQTAPEFIGKTIERLLREDVLAFTDTGKILYKVA